MSLDLYVDGPRWRAHLRDVATRYPGLVPVAKGNGYGFGLASLARRTEWLGCTTIAVGTYNEVTGALRRFSGDVVVLEPWRPFTSAVPYGARVVHTVGRVGDLAALAAAAAAVGAGSPRVVLEGLTSMRRHGYDAADLLAEERAVRGVRVEGHALHLPMGASYADEVTHWLTAAPAKRWLLSHIGADDLDDLRRRHPDVELRPRIGTELWLGNPAALAVRATVLDAHPVRRGGRAGYRQRRLTRDGLVLVVSGGTAHGIGLEAPSSARTARQRALTLARGGLDAAGHSLSPFVIAGRHRWFVEPPHMQVSLVFLPDTVPAPAIGDQVDVRVRLTTTYVDAVHLS